LLSLYTFTKKLRIFIIIYILSNLKHKRKMALLSYLPDCDKITRIAMSFVAKMCPVKKKLCKLAALGEISVGTENGCIVTLAYPEINDKVSLRM
jgi:hypothetical protein